MKGFEEEKTGEEGHVKRHRETFFVLYVCCII